MGKIINIKQATKLSQKLRSRGKKIVLVGGCFDILHVAHVKFLENAKKHGDVPSVLLENDDNVRKLKGKNRPINSQKNRAIVLSSLTCVDYIVMLPNLSTDTQYDSIISEIQPSIIATTAKDPSISHKIRQAKQVNGKVVRVLQRISDQSTSRLAKLIHQDLT
jgi:rfaE bifunctional protein nucleotidyltransferase chain/domain